MKPSEYIELTGVTDHTDDTYSHVVSPRASASSKLIHYVLGVGTESGELQDAVKRYVAYGKDVDVTNIKEEIGDCMWYLARLCNLFGFTMEDVMETNINKLKARYGGRFSEYAALNRDLDEERKVLEK